MKRFIKIALEIKMRTCLIFTGITLVAMACQLIGLTDRVDVLFLWQALLLGLLFALLQYVLVSGRRVGSRGYVGRMALFGGAFLALLAAGCTSSGGLGEDRAVGVKPSAEQGDTPGSRTEAGRDERGFPAVWPFWRVAPLA